jgi:hypothetical protein
MPSPSEAAYSDAHLISQATRDALHHPVMIFPI